MDLYFSLACSMATRIALYEAGAAATFHAVDGAKAYARDKATQRFAYLDAHLEGREFLLDRFSICAPSALPTAATSAP